MSKVNVYELYEDSNQNPRNDYIKLSKKLISRVKYNENLNYGDGKNIFGNGWGNHRGITKLKDGRFVIIFETDMQGEEPQAYVVSDEEAAREILESWHSEFFERKKFSRLKEIALKIEAESESERINKYREYIDYYWYNEKKLIK